MERRVSKQAILFVIVFIVFLISVIGFTFAFFTYQRTSSNTSTVGAGKLTLGYVEETNGINMDNVLPISDGTALNTTDADAYFDFYVTYDISSTVEIMYEIDIEDTTSLILDSSPTMKKLESNRVKVALENRNQTYPEYPLVVGPTYFSQLELTKASNEKTGYKLFSKTTSSAQTDYYRLYMWLAEKDSNGVEVPIIDTVTDGGLTIEGIKNKAFSIRINVQALGQVKE